METNKKEIKINPDLFKISNNKTFKTKDKIKKHKPLQIRPTTIKRDLLKRIKDRKSAAMANKNSFESSINLFKEISQNNESNQNNENNQNNGNMDEDSNTNVNEDNVIAQKNVEPPYSNLKNSAKPTYREWKNQTLKRHPPIVATDKIKYNIKGPNKKMLKQYARFGKKNRSISVLIKDRTMRKKIDNEIKQLKKHEISKIKEYLRDKGLIKIGSNAPDDILRETYENAYLIGDVNNTSKENLLHNYMNS